MNRFLTCLTAIALVANGALLYVVATTVFLQTHFDDLKYCMFVLITIGTPLLSILAISMIFISSTRSNLSSGLLKAEHDGFSRSES